MFSVTSPNAANAILNEKSQHFQFIGGKLRPGETPELAINREVIEEIPRTRLVSGKDFICSRLDSGDTGQSFVSPTTGALTKFEVSYFFLNFRCELKLSPNHRWVTFNEIMKGRTNDGIEIIPPSENPSRFLELLRTAPNSIVTQVKVMPIGKPISSHEGHSDVHVLVSHSSADANTVVRLCDNLEKQGVKCWISPRNLRAGKKYLSEIMSGINVSKSI